MMELSSQSGGEPRGDAARLEDAAKERLHGEVDNRKQGVATQAQSVSSALDKAAGELSDSPTWLRSAFQSGAQMARQLAETVEQEDSRQLTRDVQQMAREHPGAFLSGCALAGFAAARVLKAGADDGAAQSSDGGAQPGRYDPYGQTGQGESGSVFAEMEEGPVDARQPRMGDIP